jgi:hypothetical protein
MKNIEISRNTSLHVYLVEIEDKFPDCFVKAESEELDIMSNAHEDKYQKAARELMESMEDNWCVALLDAIVNEMSEKIVEHWQRFSPQRLQEPHYKALVQMLDKRK